MRKKTEAKRITHIFLINSVQTKIMVYYQKIPGIFADLQHRINIVVYFYAEGRYAMKRFVNGMFSSIPDAELAINNMAIETDQAVNTTESTPAAKDSGLPELDEPQS